MSELEEVQAIAESLLTVFIPKDKKEESLTFHFTIPPAKNYKVFFLKKKDNWVFQSYEAQP